MFLGRLSRHSFFLSTIWRDSLDFVASPNPSAPPTQKLSHRKEMISFNRVGSLDGRTSDLSQEYYGRKSRGHQLEGAVPRNTSNSKIPQLTTDLVWTWIAGPGQKVVCTSNSRSPHVTRSLRFAQGSTDAGISVRFHFCQIFLP